MDKTLDKKEYNAAAPGCGKMAAINNKKPTAVKRAAFTLALSITVFCGIGFINTVKPTDIKTAEAYSQPFYGINPVELKLIGRFTTSFSSSGENRRYNIALAAERINGVFIESGEAFSFNKAVGERTEKNGFKNAKIIEAGKFTEGIGGGVCQVSTTVYNAAVNAGLKIKEYHPHSLAVSYVKPSFDAMVSYGYADLKIVNPTKNPFYIKAYVKNSSVTVEFYGENSGYTYKRVSVVTETVAPPEEEVKEDDGTYGLKSGEEKVISYPKPGVKSEAYLYKYKGNKLVSKTLLRKDFYKPVRKTIIIGKPAASGNETPLSPAEEQI